MMRLRLSPRDRGLLAWGSGGAALGGVLLAIMVLVGPRPRDPETPLRPTLAPKAQPEPAPSRPEAVPSEKVQERPVEPTQAPVPGQPVELAPPFLIVDGLTFTAGLNTYRLKGLKGPPATAACRNQDGHLWACGLQARAALNNAIQRKNLVCDPAQTTADGAVEARCTADGTDVAELLAEQGWARPVTEAGPYGVQAKRAEEGRRGLWNGGWTLSGPG